MLNIKTIVSFLFLSIIFSCSNTSKVNNVKYKKIDSFLNKVSNNKIAMGTALVYKNGEVEYRKAYGFNQQPEPAIYRIGSISKTYTATIIMKLKEQKEISLEDTVKKFIPDIPNSKYITLKHLLQHRSGLVNLTDKKNYRNYFETGLTSNKLLEIIKENGVSFSPDKKYSYSNTGYILLTLIAEKVTGRSFPELVESYIAKPLKLKNTYVFDSNLRRRNEVRSFKKEEKWQPSTNTHHSIPLGSGAIASTSEEVAIFFYNLFNNKILSKESIDEMTTLNDDYGLGLFTLPYKDKVGIGHNGGIDDFRSVALYFKDSDVVFVNLSNASDININKISKFLIASFYKDSYQEPDLYPSINLPSETLMSYTGTYKSKELPIIIKFFIKENNLYAQAEGQSSFALKAVSKNQFFYDHANIKINFQNDGSSFKFIQGKEFLFTRVK